MKGLQIGSFGRLSRMTVGTIRVFRRSGRVGPDYSAASDISGPDAWGLLALEQRRLMVLLGEAPRLVLAGEHFGHCGL